MIPVPTLVKLEQWNSKTREWVVQHHAINLLHPETYVTRLASQGKIARVTDVETGEMFPHDGTPNDPPGAPCEFCEEHHVEPSNGSCLI